MTVQADFSWSKSFEMIGGQLVLIVQITDLDLGSMSVTNDVENVIDQVKVELLENTRESVGAPICLRDAAVMYLDSTGSWDEIIIGKNDQFLAFTPLPGPQHPEHRGNDHWKIIEYLGRRWLARREAA